LTFDHGGGSYHAAGAFGEEVLNGWGQDMRDGQLAQWLGDIDAGYSTYVFAECFAGGMLDDLGNLGDGQFGGAATNHYESNLDHLSLHDAVLEDLMAPWTL
jgi:hypothetical protein